MTSSRLHTGQPVAVENRLDRSILGVVRADGIRSEFATEDFERELASVIARRGSGLSDDLEQARLEARNMLRNGVYKPTGRGKPASEYLLRAAADPHGFPRVNWPVDVCNYISLKYMLPVSIWDLRAAEAQNYVFRLGKEDEEYVFNTAGQMIALQDLVVGCAVRSSAEPDGHPIVNPVKDSMPTKTTPATTSVVAAIYAPAVLEDAGLESACGEFASLLKRSSDSPAACYCVVRPHETRTC